jgi:hypothetical protein
MLAIRHLIAACALTIGLPGMAAAAGSEAAPMRYIYPAPESPDDVRYDDIIALLQSALDHTQPEYGPYELQAAPAPMTEARYLNELGKPVQEHRLVNVAWSSTSEEKERDFIAVHIPLRKGLLGYRIALIRADRQAEFDRVQDLNDLRHLVIGQGLGWGDVDVYNANEIRVVTAAYKQLFSMTAAARFDLFPRGINEIFDEFERNRGSHPNLAIEQHLLLYYPWPYYLFFNRADARLEARAEKGLGMMVSDGSFDRIFMRFHGAAIQRANLAGRRLIHLRNPLLPKDTPEDNSLLWYNPVTGR